MRLLYHLEMFKRTCEALSKALVYLGFEALALRVLLASIEHEKPVSHERVPFTRPNVAHANEPWVLKIVFEDADLPIKGRFDIRDIKLGVTLYDIN